MSIPVDIENLEDALSEYGMNPYLITTDNEAHPHITHVTLSKDSAGYVCGLGRKTSATTSLPLMIVMANTNEKKSFMKALPKLKNAVVYSHLRITDDLTINDQKTISLWLTEAKKKKRKRTR